MVHYADTSALVKLIFSEVHSTAMRSWFRRPGHALVSSDLARAELVRAVRRVDPGLGSAARSLLEGIPLLTVPTGTWEQAGRLEPTGLRTLDAVHLAAALTLGDDLDSVVTYDERMAVAAAHNSVAVSSPGSSRTTA